MGELEDGDVVVSGGGSLLEGWWSVRCKTVSDMKQMVRARLIYLGEIRTLPSTENVYWFEWSDARGSHAFFGRFRRGDVPVDAESRVISIGHIRESGLSLRPS